MEIIIDVKNKNIALSTPSLRKQNIEIDCTLYSTEGGYVSGNTTTSVHSSEAGLKYQNVNMTKCLGRQRQDFVGVEAVIKHVV